MSKAIPLPENPEQAFHEAIARLLARDDKSEFAEERAKKWDLGPPLNTWGFVDYLPNHEFHEICLHALHCILLERGHETESVVIKNIADKVKEGKPGYAEFLMHILPVKIACQPQILQEVLPLIKSTAYKAEALESLNEYLHNGGAVDANIVDTLFHELPEVDDSTAVIAGLVHVAKSHPTYRDSIVARLKALAQNEGSIDASHVEPFDTQDHRHGAVSIRFNGHYLGMPPQFDLAAPVELALLRIQDAHNYLRGRDSLPLNNLTLIAELKTAIDELPIHEEREQCIIMLERIAGMHLARATFDPANSADFTAYGELVKTFSYPEEEPQARGLFTLKREFQINARQAATRQIHGILPRHTAAAMPEPVMSGGQ